LLLTPAGAPSIRRGRLAQAGGGPNTTTAFSPPKANEFDMV
jgi:hypothetical protein